MRVRRFGLAAAGLVVAGVLAACGSDHSMAGHDMSSAPAPAGASSAAASFNDADVMFTQMMVPHHQQAVRMSDLVLAKTGIDSEVAALARTIKGSQQPEIQTMTGWLKTWNVPSAGHDMDHGSDSGMLTADELKKIGQADAGEAQKLFLTGMIKHHKGAIAMATTETTDGQYADAVALARSVVTTQQAEITTMNRVLQRL